MAWRTSCEVVTDKLGKFGQVWQDWVQGWWVAGGRLVGVEEGV